MKTKSLKRCNVVYTLKDYSKPLMQLMTNDLNEYNMRLLTTKCLNTAVLLIILLLGKKAIRMADYCDSKKTIERHTSPNSSNINNLNLMSSLEKELLIVQHKKRYLFYLLITDAYFPREGGGEDGFFPGHVIVIEKFPSKPNPFYYLYQSYINQYTLHGHFAKSNDSVKYTFAQMIKFVENLKHILTAETWDHQSVKYWKQFTFVDTSTLLGCMSKNKFFLCYQKTVIDECTQNVQKYVVKKLKELDKNKHHHDAIYGDSTKYDDREKPLTNGEMKYNLEQLLLHFVVPRLPNMPTPPPTITPTITPPPTILPVPVPLV